MSRSQEVRELLDWKRRVAELYAQVRAMEPESAWRHWCSERNRLFGTHPQTPLPLKERDAFEALDVYAYDPAARVLGTIVDAPAEQLRVPSSRDDEMVFTRVGRVGFTLFGEEAQLDVFWIDGYGGGVFLPFRDATSGRETYGAGRYLYDTIKGADLGTDGDGDLVLDFNFAYNPSCAYDPRWSCPLAPPANALVQAVEAGERTPRTGAAG